LTAFLASGRFMVIVITPLVTEVLTASVMDFLSGYLCRGYLKVWFEAGKSPALLSGHFSIDVPLSSVGK